MQKYLSQKMEVKFMSYFKNDAKFLGTLLGVFLAASNVTGMLNNHYADAAVVEAVAPAAVAENIPASSSEPIQITIEIVSTATTPEPVESVLPETVESLEPEMIADTEPVTIAIPEVASVTTPEPVESVLPETVESSVPETATDTEPVVIAIPEVASVTTPEPVESVLPETVESFEPEMTADAEPVAIAIPEVVSVATPEPVVPSEPEFIVTPEPVFMVTPESMPVATIAPASVITSAPESVEATIWGESGTSEIFEMEPVVIETPEPEADVESTAVFVPVEKVSAAREVSSSYNAPLTEREMTVLLNTCAARGISPSLALGLIYTESRFDRFALNPSGGYGLCQLNPHYFPSGLSSEDNIAYGLNFLADCIARYNGNVEAGLTAYNVGFDTGSRVYANRVLSAASMW